jgi:hypothetical protein
VNARILIALAALTLAAACKKDEPPAPAEPPAPVEAPAPAPLSHHPFFQIPLQCFIDLINA